MSGGARRVAIAGIGYSGLFRGDSPPVETLTIDAAQAALADCGLAPSAIDAIFEYQYSGDSPTSLWVRRNLGTDDLAYYGDIGGTGPSGFSTIMHAATAIAAGECETALAFRAIQQTKAGNGSFSGQPSAPPGASLFHGEFVAPYGSFNIIPVIGMMMNRRRARLGGKDEDYGHIAINARRWAALNERAVQRSPITMDDYLGARMLSDPVRLLDCDYPVSGACALILTTEERARDLRAPLVLIDAQAMATGCGDWMFGTDLGEGGLPRCAERLWARASIGPQDIDVAGLYDGFTYMTLSWIEAMGFCGPGEAGDWLDHGRTIGPGGALPLNTSGGQLAEGRLHGMSFVAEAVLQLRGCAGARQVPEAKSAAIGISHGPQVGGMILLKG